MIKFFTVSALSLLLTFSFSKSFADEQAVNQITLATVESDAFSGTGKLSVTVDDAGIMSELVFLDLDGNLKKYSIDQLRHTPQVLSNIDGRDITYLSLDQDFNPGTGGHGTVRFLNSGLSDTYLNFRFILIVQGGKMSVVSQPNLKDPDSDRNSYSKAFNYLFLKKNTIFGQTVGVSEIIPSMK